MAITSLEHDPQTKLNIKEALYAFLYTPVTLQFKNQLDTIIVRNALLGGYGHKHFTYKGTVYNGEQTPPPLKRNKLLPQLRAAMDSYLTDLEKLNNEELPFVIGFINQVLNSSNNLADYLKLLPESVHHPLRQMINTCPCKHAFLTDEKVKSLTDKNQTSISLMKQRLVINLLI